MSIKTTNRATSAGHCRTVPVTLLVARVIASLDGQQHAVSESRLLAIHLLDLQQRWLRLASGEREIVQLH